MAAIGLALGGSAALGTLGVFAVLARSGILVRLSGLAISAALAGFLARTAIIRMLSILALVLAVAIAVCAGTLARTDKAVLAIADQVLPARLVEGSSTRARFWGLRHCISARWRALSWGVLGTNTGCMVRGSMPVYHMQVARVPGVG